MSDDRALVSAFLESYEAADFSRKVDILKTMFRENAGGAEAFCERLEIDPSMVSRARELVESERRIEAVGIDLSTGKPRVPTDIYVPNSPPQGKVMIVEPPPNFIP